MKLFRWASVALLGIVSASAIAATSTVTATVTDTDGQVWSNGSWTAKIRMPGGQFSGTQATSGGAAVPATANGLINASGVLTATLADTSTLDQTGVQWTISVCPNASISPYGTTGCFSYTGPVTGANVNLTGNFSSVTAPRFPAGAQAFGYSDMEVFQPAQPGLSYFNTNTNLALAGLRLWDGNRWVAGGGSGGGGGTPSGPAGGALSGTYPNPSLSPGAALNSIGYTPAPLPTLASGAHVRYDMLPSHISGGNILLDQSGNGINATFNANAPYSTAYGLDMTNTQGVALSSSINSDRTMIWSFYVTPLNGPNLPNPGILSALLSPDQSDGLGFYYNTIFSGTDPAIPTAAYNSAIISRCPVSVIGYNNVVYIRGTNSSTDPDRMFINGKKCPLSLAGASAGLQTNGNFFLGASVANAFATRGLVGTMYYFESFVEAFTDAQASAETIAINAQVVGRGAAVAPPVLNISTPFLMADSDSIDYGTGTSSGGNATAWFGRLSLAGQPAYTMYNFGIPGLRLIQILQSIQYREAAYCKDLQGPAVIIMRGGVNDMLLGFSPEQTLTYAAGIAGAIKGTNCRLYLGTAISANTGSVNDTKVRQFNDLLRKSWRSFGADGLIDFAADPCLGAVGASAGTCFNGDNLHPNDTGAIALAAEASNRLNYDFGYTATSPHEIAGSGAYTMTSGDGTLIVTSASVNTTITLPSCLGIPDAVYTINNAQSTHAVSFIGASTSFPVNGLTSAIAIPSNSSITIRAVTNPGSSAGCYWLQ